MHASSCFSGGWAASNGWPQLHGVDRPRSQVGFYFFCYAAGHVLIRPALACRTFQTLYDSDGKVIEFGCQAHSVKLNKEQRDARRVLLAGMTKKERKRFRKLEKKQRKKQGMTEVVSLCKTADWLASKRDKLKSERPRFVEDLPTDCTDSEKELCKRRRQYRRQLQHASARYLSVLEHIRHKVDEVHAKLARFLCTTYRVILIPKFEVSQMVKRGERKLHKVSVCLSLTVHITARLSLTTLVSFNRKQCGKWRRGRITDFARRSRPRRNCSPG
jgi:hypothetical protein